jgi:hypothetical protein
VPTTVRPRRLALVTAPLVTALAVGVGVTTNGFGTPDTPTAASGNLSHATTATTATPASTDSGNRTLGTSRSDERVPLVDNRVPRPKAKLWTTENLNLRIQPEEKTKTAGLVKSGEQITVTGRRVDGFAEVINGQTTRWVSADYLSRKKPAAETASGTASGGGAPAGLSGAPCPDGSDLESALQPAAVKVYRAACAAFPELTTYGGQDGHGEHVNGQAIDFMIPSSSVGQRLADYLYAHHAELDLFDIIWSQRIWTIERSGEGFRPMSDRGSPTANHFDHVHIMVN